MDINEDKAENTPAGGVLMGKKDGQTIIHDKGTMSGYLVGKLHKDGGIKAVNKATGQPLEMQGGEVIITAPAVSDQTKREFEGKMMTNREILSAINEKGGGVSFADGGDIPAKIHTNDCEYKLGGKVVKDTDKAHSLGMNSTLKKGKQQFSSGDTTYDVDAIYNAIKKGKLRLKTKEVETFPMKYSVYDKNYAENHKIDFRKPNGITVRTESGEEVLIDGNHRMNNAYLKGRKTMKTYYIEDPKQIAKFTKKNKFELGGENKMGGHLSSGKSLKQIAEMHNVSLAHINEELAKGLEVEKEHFADFKERTRVAKDHLVENPNYYTILEKAGLKNGGHILSHHRHSENLVKDSKSGNTPARDLNNYNDVMDLEADGMVGMESGLAFAKGGIFPRVNHSDKLGKEFVYQGGKFLIVDFPNKQGAWNKGARFRGNTASHHTYLIKLDEVETDMDKNLFMKFEIPYFYNNDLDYWENFVGLPSVNSKGTVSKFLEDRFFNFFPKDTKLADGGITPIDANIEGDSVDIVESDFAKGGVVYDTTKPKIEKVTIKETRFNRASVIGRNASTVSELQQIVSDYIGNSPIEDVDWIKFYVNDSTRGSYYIDLNKGKKNTVKNVNPETLNSLNFRRVIDAKDYLVKNYDWTDFFELGSQTTASTSTKNTLKKEELKNSKIWIGDDLKLLEQVKEKLESLGFYKDKVESGDRNISVFIFINDFYIMALREKSDLFNDSSLKEIFPQDLDIDVATLGVAPKTSNASTSTYKTAQKGMVDIIEVGYRSKTYGYGSENIYSPEKLVLFLRDLSNGEYDYVTLLPKGDKFVGSPKSIDLNTQTFKDILFQNDNLAEADLMSNIAFVLFPDLVFSGFVNKNTTAPASAKPFDFSMTKINVSNNPDLSLRVQKKAFEDGWEWENGGGKTIDYNTFNYLYFTKTSISYGNSNSSFNNSPKREITEADIFGSQATASQTPTSSQAPATVKTPVVYQIKIYTTEKNSGTSSVSVARSFEDFFRIIKKLVVTKDEFVDTINLSIFSDDPNIKYSYLSFALEEQTFDLLTDIEAKENLMDSLSANNQELDFKEFFSKSKVKNVDYVIVKEPRSFPDGEKVYRGSAILPLLKEIYKNSPTDRTKVDIDLVVNGEAENDPITLTLTGVSTYSDYEINPNDINEQILYGKLKLDWLPEYQWDRLFPLIELLDFYLEDSYLQNYTTKNINELFSKLNSPEVKSSDKEIRLTWFGENGETHNFGAYFTNDATVYYQIDRDNFTLDLLRGKLDDWFYGRLSESYMFPDGQVKAKTPTSNSAVPKTVEQGVYNLDLAIQKLEKASSSVVTEYNKEIYDQSLKFLYDTKATYELALKFTPESAFMYERLDILKKLADIEKKIKNIEDMKKGGTFYMLAKILEKLERGENWKMLEQSQDVITNQIPQSEIDVIIRSQKFKNWFGDWEKALINDEYDNVSKALTEGIPTVYHHGARRIKYTYREVSNGVLYLAENISYAVWFSQNATAQSEEGNYLTECFVNIKNPIDLTAFKVNKVDLGDIVRYVDAVYPMAKIYDFIPAQVALLIKTNQPTNVRMWAWQLIRSYAKFVNHIKENTAYDGFLYYENNPSDEVVNPATGQLEENVTKAVAIFKSHQVKVVDAVLFDGGLDDWRFENGGKIKN